MARAGRLLFATLAAAACASTSAANLAIPGWALGLLPSNSHQDPKYVTALPPGLTPLDPGAVIYFVRWCAL